MKRSLRGLLLAVISVGFSLFGAAAQATILPFIITPTPTNLTSFETTLAAYGDNVNSTTQVVGPRTFTYGIGNGFTPNIAMNYSHVNSVSPGGDLGPVAYTDAIWSTTVSYLHANSGSRHFYSFVPDSLYGVRLNSATLDLYNGIAQPGNSGTLNWNIRANSTVGTILASGSLTGLTNGENRPINFGGTSYYGDMVLEFILTNVGGGTVGIDDLNFDQLLPPVPEPSTFAMLGLGLVGMAWRRRRVRISEI